MFTDREKTVLLVLAIILGLIILWAFSHPFRASIGDTVVYPMGSFQAHNDPVTKMALSPDGKIVATAGKDFTVKLWRLSDKKCLRTYKQHSDTITSLTFSPDGKWIISGSVDMTVCIWSVARGSLVRKLTGENTVDWHTGWIQCVAVSPDSKQLATGSRDTTIKIWDLNTGQIIKTLWDHQDTVTALAFSPAPTKKLLASGSTDGSIIIWDAGKWEKIVHHHAIGHNPQTLAFSPDGKKLAVGKYSSLGTELIDWQTGKELSLCMGGGGLINTMEGNVWTMDFSPDGNLLVCGSGDNGVWIFDIRSDKCNWLRAIRDDYWGDVRGVAFSPDSKKIIAAFEDGKVRVWRLGPSIKIPTPNLPSLPEVYNQHGH